MLCALQLLGCFGIESVAILRRTGSSELLCTLRVHRSVCDRAFTKFSMRTPKLPPQQSIDRCRLHHFTFQLFWLPPATRSRGFYSDTCDGTIVNSDQDGTRFQQSMFQNAPNEGFLRNSQTPRRGESRGFIGIQPVS